MNYYPTEKFSANLDLIVERAEKIKAFNKNRTKYVVFSNGTIVPVPTDSKDHSSEAKERLKMCMSQHPDMQAWDEPYEGQTCTTLLMGYGVASYLFSDEWDKVKDSVSKDKMLCNGEVIMSDWKKDDLNKSLYVRLRVFADAKTLKVHIVV